MRKIALLLVFITIFLLAMPKTSRAAEPSLTLSPASRTVNVDSAFNLEIILDTAGKGVTGVDIFHLHFDQKYLEATKIQNGSIFPTYLGNSFDNNAGTIQLSGIITPGSSPYSGSGTFAVVSFKSKAEGTTVIRFDFSPGSTEDSNMIERSSGKDILASVSEAKVKVVGEGVAIPQSESGNNESTTTSPSGSGNVSNPSNNSSVQNSGALSSPGSSGSSGTENNSPGSFIKKEATIAGYKLSMGVIAWVILDIILLVVAVILGVRFKRKKAEKIRSQNLTSASNGKTIK